MEQWKVIKDFPKYAISNYGNIKSLYWQNNVNGKLYPREKLLTSIKKNSGYLKVNLSKNNKKATDFSEKALKNRRLYSGFVSSVFF